MSASTTRYLPIIPRAVEHRFTSGQQIALGFSATTLAASAVALALIMAKVILVPTMITLAVVMPIVGISLILTIAFATLGIVAAVKARSNENDVVASPLRTDEEINEIIQFLQTKFNILNSSTGPNEKKIDQVNNKRIVVELFIELLNNRDNFLLPTFDRAGFEQDLRVRYQIDQESLINADDESDLHIVAQLFSEMNDLVNPHSNVQAFSDYMPIALAPRDQITKVRERIQNNPLMDENNATSGFTFLTTGSRALVRQARGEILPKPDNKLVLDCNWKFDDAYLFHLPKNRHINDKNATVRVPRHGTFSATLFFGTKQMKIEEELDLTDFLPSIDDSEEAETSPAMQSIVIFNLLGSIFNGTPLNEDSTEELQQCYSEEQIEKLTEHLTTFSDSLIAQFSAAKAQVLSAKFKEFSDKFSND